MKMFSRRSALATCGAVAILAGCGGNITQPSHPQSLSNIAQRPMGSGTFRAHYSGTYKNDSCKGKSLWQFQGSGKGLFIKSSTEQGYITEQKAGIYCNKTTGQATLTNARGDSITMSLNGYHIGLVGPCQADGSNGGLIEYKVTGGTGRFVNARGHGRLRFRCSVGIREPYTDSWRGTLSY